MVTVDERIVIWMCGAPPPRAYPRLAIHGLFVRRWLLVPVAGTSPRFSWFDRPFDKMPHAGVLDDVRQQVFH